VNSLHLYTHLFRLCNDRSASIKLWKRTRKYDIRRKIDVLVIVNNLKFFDTDAVVLKDQ
jgi:hypothetical protein